MEVHCIDDILYFLPSGSTNFEYGPLSQQILQGETRFRPIRREILWGAEGGQMREILWLKEDSITYVE